MKPERTRQVLLIGDAEPSAIAATRPRRTVRQQEERPNGEITALLTNEESASLWQHSQPAGGRARFPIGSAAAWATASGFQSHPNLARPPGGRHSTETAVTATTNGETETGTARKRRRLLTAWELPELIRPQPLRPRRRPRTAAIQPFYFDLAAFIFSSRYATGSQVLRRFPEQLHSERTAQRHLANMVDHGLIAVASSRGTSPNFPFAYFVTEKGTRFIKTHMRAGSGSCCTTAI